MLNVISGKDSLGPRLTSHPGIDKITFTGSSETGRKVMASAAATLKRVTLELGGNDAAIVMPDIDVDTVAPQIFWSAFANAGQICIATKRLYVHADIYDRLCARLVALAEETRLGDGTQQGITVGPVNNAAQYERVNALIDDAHDNGYRFLTGNNAERPTEGYFIPVTLIDNPPAHSRIVVEEQFGPVLPILKFTDLDAAIAEINASKYGLGGSVWCADEDLAVAIARRMATGNVFVNQPQHLSPVTAFGGHRQSGLGVENGQEGLLEYTNTQTIVRAKAKVGA